MPCVLYRLSGAPACNAEPSTSAKALVTKDIPSGARLLFSEVVFAHPKTMADKTWIVFFKRPQLETQLVLAASVQVIDDHLIFKSASGELAGLFLLEVVESYYEVPG